MTFLKSRIAVTFLCLWATHELKADVHFFTLDNVLYQYDTSAPGQGLRLCTITGVGAQVSGLAFTPSGDLWACNKNAKKFYFIDMGTCSATRSCSSGVGVNSFDFRQAAGSIQLLTVGGGSLRVYNPQNCQLVSSASTGISGSPAASAYDARTNTYWVIAGNQQAPPDKLFRVDPASGASDFIADVTENGKVLTYDVCGGAWAKGQFWLAFRRGSTVRVGILDTATGAWAEKFIFSGLPSGGSMGYAIQVTPVPGDWDGDGDVDQVDFVILESCWSGPSVTHDGSLSCQQADLDNDGDVDQSDFGIFQRCYSGKDRPARVGCDGADAHSP
jgi:hypothetical protein